MPVSDVEALADDLVTVLAVAGDDDDRTIELSEPAEPTGEQPAAARSTTTRGT